jgi:hypothetical protein
MRRGSGHSVIGPRGIVLLVALALLGACGKPKAAPSAPVPRPTAPLPTGGLAGQRVSLFPVTLHAAEDSLQWAVFLADRRVALASADSVITELITARAPEVAWIPPDELRRAARRSAGVVPDPSQMATALLRAERLIDVPDPLRSHMRTLVAIAGGRFAVVPAAVVYRRSAAPDSAAAGHPATAELSIVVVDVRVGKVQWRTVARGGGADPWSALTNAVKGLTPGLP